MNGLTSPFKKFKIDLQDELKVLGVGISICLLIYIILFSVSYLTSPQNRPSNLLWDDRRSYDINILRDRYWNIRERKEKYERNLDEVDEEIDEVD